MFDDGVHDRSRWRSRRRRRRREGELVEEGEEDEEFIDFNRFAIDASINLYSQLQQHAS